MRERHKFAIDSATLAAARRELLGEADSSEADTFRSGWLLGVEADSRTHPVCVRLADVLRARLLKDFERQHGVEFSLSFYKLAEGAPPLARAGPFWEGAHLDSHPRLNDSLELLRLLVNLSSYPRRFRYAATDRWSLTEQGVRYGRREFETLTLPPDVPERVVLLPGRTATTLHALRFFASAVPHVGLNDPPEHFLVSFEALVDPSVIPITVSAPPARRRSGSA